MNAEELSEDLKNFQLLELSYFYTAMSAAAAMPSSTDDQPITQSVEQTWLTRTLAEGEIGPHPEGVIIIIIIIINMLLSGIVCCLTIVSLYPRAAISPLS